MNAENPQNEKIKGMRMQCISLSFTNFHDLRFAFKGVDKMIVKKWKSIMEQRFCEKKEKVQAVQLVDSTNFHDLRFAFKLVDKMIVKM